MTRWRRWVFEIRAPLDEFLVHLRRGLVARGVRVEPAEHFDLAVRAFGARALVKLAWVDEGLELRVKIKAGLFSSPAGLERILLDAGREAQAALTYEREASS